MAFTGVTNVHGLSRLSQQHAGPQHAVLQLQQEVTLPKARFKPTSPKKLVLSQQEWIRVHHLHVGAGQILALRDEKVH